jgi:hypothetical protein
MMSPVKVRGDEKATQNGIDSFRKGHVCVLKKGLHDGYNLKSQNSEGRGSEESDYCEIDCLREGHFARMKEQAGGPVAIRIGVMDAMDAPQEGHGMVQAVLSIANQVEKQDREYKSKEGGKARAVQESITAVADCHS